MLMIITIALALSNGAPMRLERCEISEIWILWSIGMISGQDRGHGHGIPPGVLFSGASKYPGKSYDIADSTVMCGWVICRSNGDRVIWVCDLECTSRMPSLTVMWMYKSERFLVIDRSQRWQSLWVRLMWVVARSKQQCTKLELKQ